MEIIFTIQAVAVYLSGAMLALSICTYLLNVKKVLFVIATGLFLITLGSALLRESSLDAGMVAMVSGIVLLAKAAKAELAKKFQGTDRKDENGVRTGLGAIYVILATFGYVVPSQVLLQVLLILAGLFLIITAGDKNSKNSWETLWGIAMIAIVVIPWLF